MPPPIPGTIRIACVGDSITYGSFIPRRRHNSYPAQLAKMLGEGYSVGNFGANGRTMQFDADRPYIQHRQFPASKYYSPQLVFLMLGTNDTKEHNWKGAEQYRLATLRMINEYRGLSSRPIIVLMTPPPQFVLSGSSSYLFSMDNSRALEIRNILLQISSEEKIPCIDVYNSLAGFREYFSLDGIHVDKRGAERIAEIVADKVHALELQPGS